MGTFLRYRNYGLGSFVPDLKDPEYVGQLKARMQDRVNAVEGFATKKDGYDKLPDEALAVQLRTSEHRSMYSYVRLSIDRCTATYV